MGQQTSHQAKVQNKDVIAPPAPPTPIIPSVKTVPQPQNHIHALDYAVITGTITCQICNNTITNSPSAFCVACKYHECGDCFAKDYCARQGVAIIHDSVFTPEKATGAEEVKFGIYHYMSDFGDDLLSTDIRLEWGGYLRKIAYCDAKHHVLTAIYEQIKKHGKQETPEFHDRAKKYMDFNFSCPIVFRLNGNFSYYTLVGPNTGKTYKYTSEFVNKKEFGENEEFSTVMQCSALNGNLQKRFEYTIDDHKMHKQILLVRQEDISKSVYVEMTRKCPFDHEWRRCTYDEIDMVLNQHKPSQQKIRTNMLNRAMRKLVAGGARFESEPKPTPTPVTNPFTKVQVEYREAQPSFSFSTMSYGYHTEMRTRDYMSLSASQKAEYDKTGKATGDVPLYRL